jgi:hypothetical protein
MQRMNSNNNKFKSKIIIILNSNRMMYHIPVIIHAINLKIHPFIISIAKMLPLCLKIEQ